MPDVGFRRRWRAGDLTVPLAASALVFIVAFGLSAFRATSDYMSPFDEGYHLSYVDYVAHANLPRIGDPMSRWGEEAYACNLVAPYGDVTTAECGVDGPSELYPEQGRNTAAVWPPLYYVFTGVVTRVAVDVFGADPLRSARLASGLLWAAGAALLAGMVAWRSRSLVLAVGVGIICATSPVSYSIASYVTPHSAALLLGSVTIGCTLWAMRSRQALWLRATCLAAWGFVSAMVIPHSMAVLLAAAFALLFWPFVAGLNVWRYVLLSGSVLAGGGVGYLGWAIVQSVRQLPVPAAVQPSTPQESLPDAALQWWDLFLPPGGTSDEFHNQLEGALIVVLGYVVAGALGFWLLSRTPSHERAIAIGVVFAAPLAGMAVGYMLDFAVPSRYGATLIPAYWWMLNRTDPEVWYRAAIGVLSLASAGLMFATSYLTL